MKTKTHKVRINVTIDWLEDNSVLESSKVSEIKNSIKKEVEGIVNSNLNEFNPSDVKIRFLRNK